MRAFFLRNFIWLTLVCVGCASLISKQPDNVSSNTGKTQSEGQQTLANGIKNYEEGDYKTAIKQLQTSLEIGLDSKSDQSNAHKYLAFIYCVSNREKTCRDEFHKAFESDPKFDLQPAEAGHPIWGPVFRSVKMERANKQKGASKDSPELNNS